MSSDSILAPLTALDGENIATYDWPLPEGWPVEESHGTVLIVHGLGDHAGRYAHVASFLNKRGFHVRAYDQYGHGKSGGVRGSLPSEMRLVEDLADVVDDTLRVMRTGEPLFLLGHSMGGLVVASFVRQNARRVAGVILSSPALDPGLNMVQKLLLATLPRFWPNLRVSNGLKVDKLCRDLNVIQRYQADPLVHNKVSARLAKFIADEGAKVIAAAPKWYTPTLLLFAGKDELVSPEGSHAFAKEAPAQHVQSHCFRRMYHEILNDPDHAQVFDKMQIWLQRMTN